MLVGGCGHGNRTQPGGSESLEVNSRRESLCGKALLSATAPAFEVGSGMPALPAAPSSLGLSVSPVVIFKSKGALLTFTGCVCKITLMRVVYTLTSLDTFFQDFRIKVRLLSSESGQEAVLS